MAYIDKMHDLTMALGEIMERNTGYLDEDFAPKDSQIFAKVGELAALLRESERFNELFEAAKECENTAEQRQKLEKDWIVEKINDLLDKLE